MATGPVRRATFLVMRPGLSRFPAGLVIRWTGRFWRPTGPVILMTGPVTGPVAGLTTSLGTGPVAGMAVSPGTGPVTLMTGPVADPATGLVTGPVVVLTGPDVQLTGPVSLVIALYETLVVLIR